MSGSAFSEGPVRNALKVSRAASTAAVAFPLLASTVAGRETDPGHGPLLLRRHLSSQGEQNDCVQSHDFLLKGASGRY